jgi:hypothetical protein
MSLLSSRPNEFGRQPQDRQGAWPGNPAVGAGPDRSRHRVKRKRVNSVPRPTKTRAAQAADSATAPVLPMEIKIGDRFTDHDFEWEVLTHPVVLHGGKNLRARIRRPGLPETERDMLWPAHVQSRVRALRHPVSRLCYHRASRRRSGIGCVQTASACPSRPVRTSRHDARRSPPPGRARRRARQGGGARGRRSSTGNLTGPGYYWVDSRSAHLSTP